jgi:hypothetical protein
LRHPIAIAIIGIGIVLQRAAGDGTGGEPVEAVPITERDPLVEHGIGLGLHLRSLPLAGCAVDRRSTAAIDRCRPVAHPLLNIAPELVVGAVDVESIAQRIADRTVRTVDQVGDKIRRIVGKIVVGLIGDGGHLSGGRAPVGNGPTHAVGFLGEIAGPIIGKRERAGGLI